MSRWTVAAGDGNVEAFRELDPPALAKALEGVDEDGRGPLHLAVAGGHLPLVELLIAAENIQTISNKTDDEGWAPLHSAASMGNLKCVELLLKAGAEVNAHNEGGRTPLHYAASKGHIDVVTLLADCGANINAKDKVKAAPLHRACSTNHLHVVKFLLQTGKADLTAEDSTGATPLLVAVMAGSEPIAVELARAGADLEAPDQEGNTALTYAAEPLRNAMKSAAAGED